MKKFEKADPNPEFLIKSIAEQGYSLETAIADLIDNSISAGANNIEVLTDLENEPFNLFITDDGCGMDYETMLKNMQFPSTSSEYKRLPNDLGRFGLGLKTASFSQTRKFTVLSKSKEEKYFSGLTWDVDYLKECGEWRLIVNNRDEISVLLNKYKKLSSSLLGSIANFEPSTIVVWKGLYKFETFLSEKMKKTSLFTEITNNTSEHLSIVFHRFLEDNKKPIRIRINNHLIASFNPFPKPDSISKVRTIEPELGKVNNEKLRIVGYVLPNISISESKNGINIWTPLNKSLMDMEGIYVYRLNRLIFFGGWNGIIKKNPKLQLARLMVDVGNNGDHLFHLNVAKSKIEIPYDLRSKFLRIIVDLKSEAQKEFHNHLTSKFIIPSNKSDKNALFEKVYTNKGVSFTINKEFPLLSNLRLSLTNDQNAYLNFILKMCGTMINSLQENEKKIVNIENKLGGIVVEDVKIAILKLLELGISKETIKSYYMPTLEIDLNNIPIEIGELID